MPVSTSRISVIPADSRSDDPQPIRFEKKRNIRRVYPLPAGRPRPWNCF